MIKKRACLLFGLLYCFLSMPSFALPVSMDSLLAKHILLLKQNHTKLKTKLDTLASSKDLTVKVIEKEMLLSNMRLREINQTIQFSETEKTDLINRQALLKRHVDSPTSLPNDKARLNLEEIKQELLTKEKEIALLYENKNLLEEIKLKLLENLKSIETNRKKIGWEEKSAAVKKKEEGLRDVIDKLLSKKAALLDSDESSANPIENQVQSNLLSIETNIIQLEIKYLNLVRTVYLTKAHDSSLQTLQAITYKLNLLDDIQTRTQKTTLLQKELAHDLKEKIETWKKYTQKKELTALKQAQFTQICEQLTKKNDALGHKLTLLKENIKSLITGIEKERSSQVGLRQGILNFDIPHSKQFLYGIIAIPQNFMRYVYTLVFRIQTFVSLLPLIKQVALFLLFIVMILFWLTGKNLFIQLVEQEKRFKWGENLLHVLTRLFRRNWGAVCFFISLILLFNLSGIGLLSYKLVLMIFVVWFSFRAMIGIIRLALLERESDVEGHDVDLYHRLRWTFIAGGVITVLMVLSQQLNIDTLVTNILNRLFMFFLFTVSIVLLKARQVILMLLSSFLKPKRAYVKKALWLFSLLTPIALLINALIGLIGYTFFAWEMSYYLLVFVLGVVGYVVVRGILSDTMSLIAEGLIKYARNGWLWIEVFLKPIHRIIRVVLFMGFITLLFLVSGFDTEKGLFYALKKVWELYLINFSKVNITVGSLIEFTVLLSVFIWAAKWTRECCFRWIYRHVKDPGIRNSFSVFTQYAVVTVGSIITLRVLGVDVNGMSMILGGLAVGMGFGLRDFANNIVGGLMLLIERPIKEGDLISVDNFEGRVTHIGIRALRVRSWDHLEVMIPNAKTFSTPFTNWTHQDDVVRTVIPIKLSRQDSAVKVQELIFDVLEIIPEVLEEPSPQVYLKHIDEALIEFEVRYFINIKDHSRMAVRSIVLFAITAQFKAAGIKAPIPPVSIDNLKSCKD